MLPAMAGQGRRGLEGRYPAERYGFVRCAILHLLLFLLLACSREQQKEAPHDAGAPKVADGLRVETFGTITLVRVDPARFKLRLLNAAKDGGARKASRWADDFGLLGVANASMYEPSGASVGLMINGPHVNQARDVSTMGGYFAFEPARDDLPKVAAFGRDCAGFDLASVRRSYAVVFQNYRLLDCEGHAVAWKDARRFSAAAIGLGKDGHVVFAHSRAPHAMTEFSELLATPELGLAQMFYVEGGPEASVYVKTGDVEVRAIGSSLDDFMAIPNVVGFAPL
jgi:uncharacterized protein YigE (DUF2233 family)